MIKKLDDRRPDLRQCAPFSVMHLCLPYGKYICADGTEVFFNRYYQPIWKMRNGQYLPADPGEWITYATQEWFYDDHNPPWVSRKTHEKCLLMLQARHKASALPEP
jgi:hypothetical protein